MVGTFCAICTAPGYPCSLMEIARSEFLGNRKNNSKLKLL